MRHLLLMVLATALVCGGCDDDDDDKSIECNLSQYTGDFMICTQADIATLAGHTSISGNLDIFCPSCTDLSELSCLVLVGGYLSIDSSNALTDLEGFSALTSVGDDLIMKVDPMSRTKSPWS